MSKGKIALMLIALVAVTLSLMNASWLAGAPPGRLVLVANRGVAQAFDPAAAGDCSARAIRPLAHPFIENTVFSMHQAIRIGARGLALDVRASADGQAMVFRDATLECRTNGTGAIADRPLAYLRTLDIGHGYTFDNGQTFPLRGRGVGGMPIVEEVLQAFPSTALIFTLATPADADALVAAFARTDVPIGAQHGFAGSPEALARLRQRTRAGWVIDRQASAACLAGYRRWGWAGAVPDNCAGVTLVLPRRGEWKLWGWPYRFMARLTDGGARLFIAGDRDGVVPYGLDQPDQLGEVPRDYRGLLLIEDMYDVGRALER